MLELYHSDMSVCAAKVRQVCAEKGLEWTPHGLNLGAGDAQKPEYLKLNPGGVVPTLIDDGRVVIESTVICEYLDDKWPSPPLKPADAHGRARMRLWTKQLDEGVHAAIGTISYCIALRLQHASKSPAELDAFLAKIPTQERRERIGSAIRLGMEAPGFAPALARYAKLLDDMQRTLSASPWLAGDTFSLADIAYTPYMTRLEHLGLEQLIRSRPQVAGWADRLQQRPSYQTAMTKWFNEKLIGLMTQGQPAARARLAAIVEQGKSK